MDLCKYFMDKVKIGIFKVRRSRSHAKKETRGTCCKPQLGVEFFTIMKGKAVFKFNVDGGTTGKVVFYKW